MPVALQCSAAAQQAPAGSGLRAVKAGAQRGGSDGGTPPRRSRLQFLYDVAQRTFNQPTEPTDQQIQALRLTLSEWGRRWAAHAVCTAAARPPPGRHPTQCSTGCLLGLRLCRSSASGGAGSAAAAAFCRFLFVLLPLLLPRPPPGRR